MDRFNEYWNLLSNRNIKIGKELISYYKSINENEENYALSNECKDFLKENLQVNAYPTCQILRMLKHCPIFEFCEISVPELLKYSHRDHICNILCNLPIPYDGNNEIFTKINEKIKENVIDKQTVHLSLLARKNLKLLQRCLKWEKKEMPEKLLTNAIDYKSHWVLDVIAEKGDNFNDKELMIYLKVMYVIVLINLEEKFDLLSSLVQGIVSSELMVEKNLLEYFTEIRKNLNVLQLISDRKVNFNEFPKHRGVLNKLIMEHVSINLSNFDAIQTSVIENADSYREKIILDQFFSLKLFIDSVFLDPLLENYEMEIERKLAKIKSILRGFDDVTSYLELIEYFYILIFLRNDHFASSQNTELGSETCLSRISSARRLSRKSVDRSLGFICNQFLLEKILNLLKLSLMQKKHSLDFGEADDDLKMKFSRFVEYINDGLCRLNLYSNSKTTNEAKRKCFFNVDYSKIIILHQEKDGKSSTSSDLEEECESDIRSDEEKAAINKYSTFSRRRGMRKRRKVKSSSENTTTTGSETTNTTIVLDVLKKSSSQPEIENLDKYEKNIIAKILGTPETLATIFMIREDIEAVQRIIKTYKLENTELASDISFLERFQKIKEKLNELVETYESKVVDCKSDFNSQIDSIKNLTAIGFETSKILNVIENFVTSNKIQQNDDILEMVSKYKKNFPFLSLFTPEKIHVVNIIDLTLSLPTGYDLNLNIYNMMTKFLEKSSDRLDGIEVKNVSYLRLIKNIVDGLYHYKTILNREITITDLLIKEIYPLTSSELSLKLERYKLFKEFNEGERGIDQIDLINNFPAENNYFQSILKMVENMKKLQEFSEEIFNDQNISIDELLRLDIESILTDLVFLKKIPPEKIANTAFSLNTNLVHVIVKNTDKFEMTMEIMEYVAKQNHLIGFLINNFYIFNSEPSYEKNLLENLSKIDENFINLQLKCDTFDFKRSEDLDKISNLSDLYVKLNKNQIMEEMDELVLQKLNENNVELISDINLRARKTISLIPTIESLERAEILIKNVLLSKENHRMEKSSRKILENWLQKINIYRKIKKELCLQSWLDVKSTSENNPQIILNDLLEAKLYNLCSEWIKIHPIVCPTNQILDSFTYAILKEIDCGNILIDIVEKMDPKNVIELYEIVLPGLKSLKILNYIVDYLTERGQNQQKYQKYKISSAIFHVLNEEERKKSWNLLSRPILIIEQYLMNSKFEILAKIFSAIRPYVKNVDCDVCGGVREYMMEIRAVAGPINLDVSHKDVFLSHECLDCLLRIYAAKALDFRIVTENNGSTDMISTSDLSSLDSLYEPFKMPKEAPDKSKWVKDDECSHCMCCRRSVFTMLTRRHHCRRCGRVVCYGCSTKRMKIPELYADILVRICDDCSNQTDVKRQSLQQNASENQKPEGQSGNENSQDEWKLSGNVRHDNIVREEFGYEYAPSVSLCLSICNFHSANQECANFLLYHCGKLESLIRPIQPGYPNPEIDYALIARMLHCLSIAAKVRNDSSECDIVKDHAEIILAIVQNRCEALLPQEPLNSTSLRRLKDSLVKMEKYSLALELSLKCGFSASGVLAAWGISCLRAGSYETAREKFSHCMQKISSDEENSMLISYIESESILNLDNIKEVTFVKRPAKSPPLLSEIIQILEVTSQPQPPEVLARANVILSSNSSLSSSRSMAKKENITLHEPALNILNTLANLKQISNGIHNDFIPERRSSLFQMNDSRTSILSAHDYMRRAECINNTRYFEESMYYLTTYGNHYDTIVFLMKHKQVVSALKYTLLQKVDPEIFTNLIILPYLKIGELEKIIKLLVDFDDTLLIWKEYVVQFCRFLEVKGMLNSLYHMQTLLKDPIRASMTCVRFYSMNCRTFNDLHVHSYHLENAQKHLESELELCNWEEINVADGEKFGSQKSLLMKMDLKTLNGHINTILRQMEVAKFLANCESCGRETVTLLSKLFIEAPKLPTLFGSVQEKMQLAVLTLVCGHNIEEGFGLSFRIIQDFNLDMVKVYGITAKYLCTCSRFQDVEKLLVCVGENNGHDSQAFSDEIICLSVKTAVGVHGITPSIKSPLDSLIKKIKDVGLKISCHVSCGQLKAGYLLAVQHNRINDVKKILRQAEASNQVHIKRLCEKKLSMVSQIKG